MSYNSNIPIGTDPLLKSQRQIRANYQAINSVFSENHVAINSVLTGSQEFQGMHNSLTFRVQTVDPTTSSTQIALYTKAVSSIPMLFFRPRSNQTPIQLTYPSISTGIQSTNPDVYKAHQYSFMAGPFIIYGGLISAVMDGQNVPLSPSTTLIYASASILNTKSIGGATSLSNTLTISGSSFTINIFPNIFKPDIYYLAIGKE